MDNRCPRFENCKNNACKNKIITYNCNPANKEYWNYPAIKQGEDPVNYNVMNGCWMCNYTFQQYENEALCNRQFFSSNIQTPCNKIKPCVINSNMIVKKKYLAPGY